ncbi:uncharacterized protein EI97DRAFT_480414 [Westerdykella ornata]|uniref:Nucleoporin Nup54 alpha-helical domain-containing protein n=1 Tax=Westerdykella ornata TaxID=318751 RepID=A0A6A6JB66_WESOR|nr:uncharacterized protein EI97DRAFT_480414 [Westerdykella ornata]KAF2273507.1 hypothetical protein EI97DRAFT_480414 [Westerdykella ornata]
MQEPMLTQGRSGNTATSQGQKSAGLFGSTTTSSQPATTGGLFGSTSQPQSGGLFGTAATTSQAPQTGSLFGASTQTGTSQPQSTGGLFGNLSKPATSGTTGGSLFGGLTAASSQPQQSGGLFGSATQTQAKPSLFGSTTQQTTTTPSLFGATTTQPTTTPSLFGASQQNQPQQQQSSLFGGMSTQNVGTQPAQGGGVQLGWDSVKGTTRFHELHPDLQKIIQELDNKIQSQMSDAGRIREILPGQGDLVATLSPDVAYIEQLLATVELGIDNDSNAVSRLKDLVASDVEEATLCFRAATNQSLPSQFHYRNAGPSASRPSPAAPAADENDPSKPVDLVSYFSKRADSLAATLEVYQRQMREIETHLRTMEAGTVEKAQQLVGSRSGVRDQRRELAEAMRAIEGAIIELAGRVGKTRDAVVQRTLGSVGGGGL